MGRHGVSYLDIVQAAISVKKQGQEPTVDRIREYLGTGSKSTIAPLLRKWKEKTEDNTIEELEQPLPTELLSSVHDLYESIEKRAANKIEVLEKSFEEEKKILTDVLSEKESLILNIQAQLIEETTAHHNQKEAYATLYAEKIACLEEISIEKQKYQQVQEKLHYLQENHDRLLEDQRALQKHFDYYQQHIAEEHRKTKDRWIANTNELKQSIKEQRQAKENAMQTLSETTQKMHTYETSLLLEQQKNQELLEHWEQEKRQHLETQKEKEEQKKQYAELILKYRDIINKHQVIEKDLELSISKQQLLEKNNLFLYQLLEEEKQSRQDLKSKLIQFLDEQHNLGMQNPQSHHTDNNQEKAE